MTIVREEIWVGVRLHGKEPFGFNDGISKVRIKGINRMGLTQANSFFGYANQCGFSSSGPLLDQAHDPSNILPRVLNPHYAGLHDFGANGSFLCVPASWNSNVSAFWKFMKSESVPHYWPRRMRNSWYGWPQKW
jgi:hypothetical protein